MRYHELREQRIYFLNSHLLICWETWRLFVFARDWITGSCCQLGMEIKDGREVRQLLSFLLEVGSCRLKIMLGRGDKGVRNSGRPNLPQSLFCSLLIWPTDSASGCKCSVSLQYRCSPDGCPVCNERRTRRFSFKSTSRHSHSSSSSSSFDLE